MLAPNTILRERYRIINELGHGGMGAVYQAMDENLSCVVAVKETFAATDEQRRAFRREAELLANLSHPTLPKVTDHFTHGDGQFLVMQFVAGHDLAELLDLREQPFPVSRVLEWADQLLDALEELHSCNPPIIHRDIKPSNLKVTPKGKILLLDFGLAKGVAGQMSTASVDSHGKSIYGYTPHYAPLEQMRGAGTDARSDLYSLAATLWTLLTGEVPPDALARVAEKEEGNPDPLRPAHEINPKVPLSVSNVLQRAMTLNRNQRQASVVEFRNELGDVRQAESEHATLPLQRPKPPEPTSIPQGLPPLPPTMKAPDPTSQSPSSNPPNVPTMRVDSPPAVASWDRAGASPTSASFPGGDSDQRRAGFSFQFRWGRVALIVGSVLVMATSFVVWRATVGERASMSNLSASAPTQTNNGANPNANTMATNNPTAPAGMVYVPGGEFRMGRDEKDGGDEFERPAHKATVKPFFIDQYEVTCDDYAKFIKATNHRAPSTWVNGNYPEGAARKPVTAVTWDDASAYAKWAGKRLPTEEEWEFAARGADGRRYPWGDEWKSEMANADGAGKGLADAGAFKGASSFGAYDMVGNAWEWTSSNLRAYPGGRLPATIPAGELKVIRGGSYESTKDVATTTYRTGWPARGTKTYDQTGFRCVVDVP